MQTITYQPALRPALPCVYGPLDYREQRDFYERIDGILKISGLEQEFVNLAVVDRGLDVGTTSAKRADRFARMSVLALRSNIARKLTGLDHREFCTRLADSSLLQWFLSVGRVDAVKVFSKSTSDRFGRWVGEETVRAINARFTALLTESGDDAPSVRFGLECPINCEEVFFDSTCLTADIHFPTDWVLLRDAVRTLMKATVLIRGSGLRKRMPMEPLAFLSEMNTLCMRMSAARRTVDSKRQRKKVLREMKALAKRIADHALVHKEALVARRNETDLTEGRALHIIRRIEGVLDQLPAAIKQAHERIIGGRKVPNEEKILSLYDDSVQVLVRGKAGAEVEFGNKLWLGESREGLVVDYKLYQDNPGDSTLVDPAIRRLVIEQAMPVKHVWGDRGLFGKTNDAMLDGMGIRSGLCPRGVKDLADRLRNEPGFREGLKRRAGTEARIAIFKNVFMGRPAREKGFGHRELAVGWAALSHNLWVVARMARTAQLAKEARQQAETRTKPRRDPGKRAA
jgi:IS5 family transposase